MTSLDASSAPLPSGPRERALEDGIASLGDAELLAVLLGTGLAGRPVGLVAAALLEGFSGPDGLLRAGFATDDPSLIAAVVDFGQQGGWMPGYRFYHADDVAVGHAWLDLYRLDPASKERLGPIKGRLDHIIAHPITEELNDFTANRRPQVWR